MIDTLSVNRGDAVLGASNTATAVFSYVGTIVTKVAGHFMSLLANVQHFL